MTGTRRPLPAQLPHQIPDFTGRHAELDRLDALVADDRGDGGTSVVITSIAGTAGVGKTALAVHWAHRISEPISGRAAVCEPAGLRPDRICLETGRGDPGIPGRIRGHAAAAPSEP